MADSSKSLIECVSDDSDEDEDTVESDSCKKVSIFRAFSARFGSIFGKVYENFPKAFSAKFRAYYTGA